MFVCGQCERRHHSAEVGRRCHAGKTYPCGWQIQVGLDEDGGAVIDECGAAAWDTERGWKCDAGHEHVTAEARWREGWDYAADPGEAMLLARAGVQPVAMDGGPIEMAPLR